MVKVVTVNGQGKRVGESHPKAELTDHEVELMREIHEEGYGYRRLAKMFEVGKTTVRQIVRYETRCCSDVRRKVIKDD